MKLFNYTVTALAIAITVSLNADVVTVTTQEQLQEVLKKPNAVIKVGAKWCPACVRAEKPFESLAQELPDVGFGLVDVDEFKNFAQTHNVASLPTFIYYKNGKEIKRSVGFSENFKKDARAILKAEIAEKKTEIQELGQEPKPEMAAAVSQQAAKAEEMEPTGLQEVCPERTQSIFENWATNIGEFFSNLGQKIRSLFY